MDWIMLQNIFGNIAQESAKQKVKFVTPLTPIVGEFAKNVGAAPEERKGGFWHHNSGIVQKWAQDELFALGLNDQRYKFSRSGSAIEIEFTATNLTEGSPVETMGRDATEVTLQALLVALKDLGERKAL